MNVGLVLPGFSADEDDWCIPALRDLARELTRSDQVRVFALRYPYRAGPYYALGARVVALGGGQRRLIGSAALWRRLLVAIVAEHRQTPFDVLHAFWATESGCLAAIAGRALGIPSIVSVAGGELVGFRDLDYGDQLRWAQRLKVLLALRLSDVVTVGSEYLRALVEVRSKSLATGKLTRAPLGVDTDLFQPDPAHAPNHTPRLVHVGSLTPVKDQTTLLRAVARLRLGGVDAQLAVAGGGPLRPALVSLATDLRIDRAVEFLGEVPHDELRQFYQQGDLFVLSSRHEAQCLAVLEAAAGGVPTVGTAVGVVPELAPDAAVAVPPGQPDALADAIGAMLSRRADFLAMGRSARQRVESEFEVRACADRFRQIYQHAAIRRDQPTSSIR